MNGTEIAIGIALLISLAVFAFYGLLAIRHAARFRYLSKRTLYLTLFFIGTSTLLILMSMGAYVMFLLKTN